MYLALYTPFLGSTELRLWQSLEVGIGVMWVCLGPIWKEKPHSNLNRANLM